MFSDNEIAASQELSNALEAATILIYLIRIDHNNSSKVLQWAEMTNMQLQRMGRILKREPV